MTVAVLDWDEVTVVVHVAVALEDIEFELVDVDVAVADSVNDAVADWVMVTVGLGDQDVDCVAVTVELTDAHTKGCCSATHCAMPPADTLSAPLISHNASLVSHAAPGTLVP